MGKHTQTEVVIPKNVTKQKMRTRCILRILNCGGKSEIEEKRGEKLTEATPKIVISFGRSIRLVRSVWAEGISNSKRNRRGVS